jgi:hypothetical protein
MTALLVAVTACALGVAAGTFLTRAWNGLVSGVGLVTVVVVCDSGPTLVRERCGFSSATLSTATGSSAAEGVYRMTRLSLYFDQTLFWRQSGKLLWKGEQARRPDSCLSSQTTTQT